MNEATTRSEGWAMLILERKRGQRIVIGEDVIVSVECVLGGKVLLGIAAPASVRVDREEVRRAKDAERAAAS